MRHGRLYQQRIKNAFDKKVRPCKFNEGDLVLKKISHVVKDNPRKWAPNYEGPFVVKKGFFWRGSGAHQHGWRGATLTRELRCCQAILHLRSGAIEEIIACSFIFVCVLLGFPQGFLSAVIFSSQFFKRRERRFEASILTLVLNHVQFVIT